MGPLNDLKMTQNMLFTEISPMNTAFAYLGISGWVRVIRQSSLNDLKKNVLLSKVTVHDKEPKK